MVRKKTGDRVCDYIWVVVIILMATGAVFVFSASANLSQQVELHRFYDFPALRQILFFPVAVIVMYMASAVDYHRLGLSAGWLKSPMSYFLVLSIALLVLVSSQRVYASLPGLIPEINRHFRWLRIPAGPVSLSFQPSELAKWVIIIFLAGFCDRFRDSMGLYWKRFIPICVIVALVVGVIIVEDFGTAVFISFLSFLMLLIAGVKLWHILTPIPFWAVVFAAALLRSQDRVSRIWPFLNPEKWAD